MPDNHFSETKKVETPSDTPQQKESSPLPKMGFGPYEKEGPSPTVESDNNQAGEQGDLPSLNNNTITRDNGLIQEVRREQNQSEKSDDKSIGKLFEVPNMEISSTQKSDTSDFKSVLSEAAQSDLNSKKK